MSNLIDLIDEELLAEEEMDERYIDSPFYFLKGMHAKQKGKRYEKITECVLQKLGYEVSKPTSTEYDRIVDGQRCEIKGSTLNKGKDVFSFLQIRPDQEYDAMIFTMCYPQELVMMEMTKKQILANIKNGTFKKQHGGNKAESRTFMYYGNKETLAELGAVIIE